MTSLSSNLEFPKGRRDRDVWETFGVRLNIVLERKGLPVRQRCAWLVQNFGLTRAGAHLWVRGERIPEPNTLLALANKLGCSIDFLLGREPEDSLDTSAESKNMVHIGTSDIGSSTGKPLNPKELSVTWSTIVGPTNINQSTIEMAGDRMSPTIMDGDLVLFDKQISDIVDDSIYCLDFSGKGLLSVRRALKNQPEDIKLVCDNPKYLNESLIIRATEEPNRYDVINASRPFAVNVVGQVTKVIRRVYASVHPMS